ncbi:hypothetical protein L6R50_20685 [Myxococcota bacterium]|nr:hypothetical protein [Myxococcota bacterium]
MSERDLDKILAELLTYLDESAEQFVRRRHTELRREGLRNPQIFVRIEEELKERRFRAPPYTERQLRRLIYG